MKLIWKVLEVLIMIALLSFAAEGIISMTAPIETILPQKNVMVIEVIEPAETKITPLICERVEVTSAAQALEMIELTELRIQTLQNLNSLGSSDERISAWVSTSLHPLENDLIYYTEQYEIFTEVEMWDTRMEEYPVATTIWLFLKDQGYNDYVVAGILGNIMTESGGGLNINPTATNGQYYGICQWGSGYPGRYVDLDGQLNLLMETIEYEFTHFSGYGYDGFCLIQNEQEAALAFARAYERCASYSYSARQVNATTALNYFTNN